MKKMKMKIVFCFLYFAIAVCLTYLTFYPNNKIIEGKTNIFKKIINSVQKVTQQAENVVKKDANTALNFAEKEGKAGLNWIERRVKKIPPPPPPPPVNGQMDGNNVWYIPSSSSQYYADLSSKNLFQTKQGNYLYRLPNTVGYNHILTTGPLPT